MVKERRVARDEALTTYTAQVMARRQQDVTLPTLVSIATTTRLPSPLTQLLSFVAIIARNDDLDIEFSSDEEETLSRDGYDGGVDFSDSRREDNIADDSLELLALDTQEIDFVPSSFLSESSNQKQATSSAPKKRQRKH
jgi:hypothetical protein